MKKYTEMMEHIRPTEVQKNRMLNNALNPKTEKKSFKLKYCAIAAAACAAFSTTVFADEIKETFYNLLGADEIVSQDVLSNIYSDTDGHVTMTVKEALSDRIRAYAVVEYISHDEVGKVWLENYEPIDSMGTMTLNVHPEIKDGNNALYGVNFSQDCDELEEYKTEDKRVFKLNYISSGENFGTNCIGFHYDLVETDYLISLDVSDSVEIKDIVLDSNWAPDRTYKPTGIKLSSLGFMIYGKNCGNYEANISKYGSFSMHKLSNESVESLYLIMKDGTSHDLLNLAPNQSIEEWAAFGGGGSQVTAVLNPEVDYDISIYCGTYRENTIDIETIAGIELDGIYYSLE